MAGLSLAVGLGLSWNKLSLVEQLYEEKRLKRLQDL
jgi:hypothetical protein